MALTETKDTMNSIEYLIIGDGAAGINAALEIRKSKPHAGITLVSNDPIPFYYRAALTNYLYGKLHDSELWGLPASVWEQEKFQRIVDEVISIDPTTSQLTLKSGHQLHYQKLLIASGAKARELSTLEQDAKYGVEGADAKNIFSIRTLNDVRSIQRLFPKTKHAVVLGGGILGLEIAEAMVERGINCTIVHRGEFLLERVVDPFVAELIQQAIEADGTPLYLKSGLKKVISNKHHAVQSIDLTCGASIPCDLLISCIGTVPNTRWLKDTDIECSRGLIKVGTDLKVPNYHNIWVAGDVAIIDDPDLPFRNPTGLWQPAVKQGQVAGINMSASSEIKQARYQPGVLLNATRAWGINIITAGESLSQAIISTENSFDVDSESSPLNSLSTQLKYKRLRIIDGKLSGFLLAGDRREAYALHRLINLRNAPLLTRDIAQKLIDPNFDIFSWVEAQQHWSGNERWKHTVPVVRGPVLFNNKEAPLSQNDFSVDKNTSLSSTLANSQSRLVFVIDNEEISFDKANIKLGGGEQADIHLAQFPAHFGYCHISKEGHAWFISSDNHALGLKLNGTPLHTASVLKDLDLLQLGDWKALLRFPDSASTNTPKKITRRNIQGFSLLGVKTWKRYEAQTLIGSSDDNDIQLTSKGIALFHAQINVLRGDCYITDSGGGVLLNEEKISLPRKLSQGDIIQLGTEKFNFQPLAETVHNKEKQTTYSEEKAYVMVMKGKQRHSVFPIALPAIIGRHQEADLVLDDLFLSRQHIRIEDHGQDWWVYDLGSSNGSWVNDTRLYPHEKYPLTKNDTLRIGSTVLSISADIPLNRQLSEPKIAREKPKKDTATRIFDNNEISSDASIKLIHTASLKPITSLLDIDLSVLSFKGDGKYIIGREPKASLQQGEIPIPLKVGVLSRRHALLEVKGNYFTLQDLGSSLHTYVNGKQLGESAIPIKEGDIIKFDFLEFSFHTAVAAEKVIPKTNLNKPAPWQLLSEYQLPSDSLSSIPLKNHQTTQIGRKPQGGDNNVTLDIVGISRQHLEIKVEQNQCFVRDLDSTRGTLLNGKSLTSEFVPLKEGDRLTLDLVSFILSRQQKNSSTPTLKNTQTSYIEPDVIDGYNPLEKDISKMVYEELDSCIGCHECMRACPLPDSESISIANLNAYAGGTVALNSSIQHFVEDCTQCDACVPACPVNIQRSRIVLWNKLKTPPSQRDTLMAEVGSGELQEINLSRSELRQFFSEQYLFKTLDASAQERLFATVRIKKLFAGETLIKEGEYSQTLWMIISGGISSLSQLADGNLHEMVHLQQGHLIGIQAVLADQASDAHYQAKQTTLLLGLSKYALTAIKKQNTDFSNVLKRSYIHHTTEYFLATHPLFKDLDDTAKRSILSEFEVQKFAQAETLLKAENLGKNIYFILRGFAQEQRLEKGNIFVANYLKAGESFGFDDSQRRGEFSHITATTPCDIAVLSAASLEFLEASIPDLRQQLSRHNAAHHNIENQALVNIIHGSQIMAIDTRLCVDCDNCVSACERRHGHSRLDRSKQNLQVGNYHFPGACYHCDDPKCLLCSVDGIIRLPSGEIQIQNNNCIGCGACAERCPYDNIRMVERQTAKGGIFNLIKKLMGKPIKNKAIKNLAVKCDLCADYNDGPACVRSCPTGAAMRVDPSCLDEQSLDKVMMNG